MRNQQRVADPHQISQLFLCVRVAHDRADRNRHVQVLAAAAKAIVATAGLAGFRLERSFHAKVREAVHTGGSTQIDATAMPAVTAIRPAKRRELLATEAHAAAAAVAGLNFGACLVDEFHGDREQEPRLRAGVR